MGWANEFQYQMKAEVLSFKMRPCMLRGPPALKPRAPLPRVKQAKGKGYYSLRSTAVSKIACNYFLTSYYILKVLNKHMGLEQVSLYFEVLGMNLCYLKKKSLFEF